jgi:hypothetical protein
VPQKEFKTRRAFLKYLKKRDIFFKIQSTVALIEANRTGRNSSRIFFASISARFRPVPFASMKYVLRCELDRIRKQPKTEGMEYFGCFRWKPNAFFLTCHIQYGRRKGNSRSESLSRIIRRYSRPTVSREHLWARPCPSVAFSLPAWPVGSLRNNGKIRHC